MAVIICAPELSSITGCFHQHSAKVLPNANSRNSHGNVKWKGNNTRAFGFRVCCRVKDLEPRIPNVEHNLRLYGQFSAPVKPNTTASPKQSKEEEEKQDYYVNTGYAIRTLREEFPALFYKELSFDIYRDDVVFKDPINNFVGIENYKSIFWALRFHGRMFFSALWVDIIGIWQPAENMIVVRWTVHGILRVPWESRGKFDGISEYKLDKNGKIFEHRVHNIAMNTPSKFRVLAVIELLQSIVCPSTPKPTCFENSSAFIKKAWPFSFKLNGFCNYLASILTTVQSSEAEQSQRT